VVIQAQISSLLQEIQLSISTMDKSIVFGLYGMVAFQVLTAGHANQFPTGKHKTPQPVNMHFRAQTPC
jgi:hypothetical protein